jgi:TPR repeat protein
MLTFSRVSGIVLFGLAACLPGSRIGAFEATDGAAVEKAPLQTLKAPLQTFATPRAALQAGLEGFRSGNATSAIEALKYAAAGGEVLAQWKLAKIYASGDGVPRDDLKAYDYFSQIVTNYDEDDPNRRDRAVVSSALVSLGVYNLNGIANSEVRPNPQRALQMFQFAATTFGDADAQYNLARMHLDGAGVDKDGREALRWLFLAADKGHLQAQALLGQTLFTGRDDVRPQRARGLMWLTLAREAAVDSTKDKWIIDLYDKAVAAANDRDRQGALAYLEDHLKRRN